jgi:hypothetical protein
MYTQVVGFVGKGGEGNIKRNHNVNNKAINIKAHKT